MIHRGIVVVHGVGEQQRADQLDTVTERIVGFLNRGLGHANVRLVTRTHRDGGAIASATIHLTPPNGAEPEEWHIREAWWAQSFKPSNKPTTVGWAMRAFIHHVIASARVLVGRNIARAAGSLTPSGLQKHLPPWMRTEPDADGVWRVPRAGAFLFYLLDAINWFLITLGYAAIYLVGFALLYVVQLFLLLPLGCVLPDVAERIRRTLINLITGYIGDQHAMTNRYVAISAAANSVSTALSVFLHPRYLEEKDITYETVTVIAHSGGAVVSYEALAGKEVSDWVAANPARRVNFITVGSGLNLAWRMRARRKARDRAFWSRRIDRHVNWVDIYARYDPVPQGPAPADLVNALAGPASGRENGRERPYVSLRVANADWPFSDHGGYWANREEVMSRIVQIVSDSRLGVLGLNPPDGSWARDDELRPHPLGPAIAHAVGEGRRHRRSVTTAQTLRLAVAGGIVALVLIGADTVANFGRWLLGTRGSFAGQDALADGFQRWLNGVVPHSLLFFDLSEGNRAWLTGAAVILTALFAISLVAGPIQQAILWFKVEEDDPPPAPYTPTVQVAERGTFVSPPGSFTDNPTLGGDAQIRVRVATDGSETSGQIQIALPGDHRLRAARIDRVESSAGHDRVEGLLMDGMMTLRAFRLEFKTSGGRLLDLAISRDHTPGSQLLVHVTGAQLQPLP